MPGKVKFFRLGKRFVDEKDAPPEVKQLEYYALAIGHHIGVVDCLVPVMVMEESDYFQWIRKLPPGKARSKLEGLAKWGELEINREHVAPFASALAEAASRFLPEERQWADSLLQLLHGIQEEPAIYLVVRRGEGKQESSIFRAAED